MGNPCVSHSITETDDNYELLCRLWSPLAGAEEGGGLSTGVARGSQRVNTYCDVLMQVPARSLRQNLIHPPFVKRVYSECSPLIQLIALINNLKADKNDTILVMIESKSHSFCSVSRLYLNSYNPECKILDCFVCKSE